MSEVPTPWLCLQEDLRRAGLDPADVARRKADSKGEKKTSTPLPSLHTSGHWTIEGSVCSQFENHLRAIHGLPLGSTEMAQGGVATMINLIGEMPEQRNLLGLDGVHVHDYGKSARQNRKLGHATVVGADREAEKSRAMELA